MRVNIALPRVNSTKLIPNFTKLSTIPVSTKQLVFWVGYHVYTFTEVLVKAQLTKLPLNLSVNVPFVPVVSAVAVVPNVPPFSVDIPPKDANLPPV